MRQKLGFVAGTGVVLAGTALFTAYQVQGKTMPEWLFTAIVGGGVVVLLVALATWVGVYVLVPGRNMLRSHSFRSPLVAKGKPDRNQWLLDIAKHDAENPQGELRLVSQRVTEWSIDEPYRPWIKLGFRFFNGGVHTILLGPATGKPKHNGKELKDDVETDGKLRLDRGGTAEYRVKLVLPKKVAEQVFRDELTVEVARSFRRTRSISLSGVTLQVESEPRDGNGAHTVAFGLGIDDTFLVGDTN